MVPIQLSAALLAAIQQGLLEANGYQQMDEALPPADPQQIGVWRLIGAGEAVVLEWYGGPEIATEADLLALWQGAEWRAIRRRARYQAAVDEYDPRLDAAGWSLVPRSALEDPSQLSAANLLRRQADIQAMTGALAALSAALIAAADIEAIEAVTVTWPTLLGPEVVL